MGNGVIQCAAQEIEDGLICSKRYVVVEARCYSEIDLSCAGDGRGRETKRSMSSGRRASPPKECWNEDVETSVRILCPQQLSVRFEKKGGLGACREAGGEREPEVALSRAANRSEGGLSFLSCLM